MDFCPEDPSISRMSSRDKKLSSSFTWSERGRYPEGDGIELSILLMMIVFWAASRDSVSEFCLLGQDNFGFKAALLMLSYVYIRFYKRCQPTGIHMGSSSWDA